MSEANDMLGPSEIIAGEGAPASLFPPRPPRPLHVKNIVNLILLAYDDDVVLSTVTLYHTRLHVHMPVGVR